LLLNWIWLQYTATPFWHPSSTRFGLACSMALVILMWNQSAENWNPGSRSLGVSTMPIVVVFDVSGCRCGLPSRFQVHGSGTG
jgi:hypothetical protein